MSDKYNIVNNNINTPNVPYYGQEQQKLLINAQIQDNIKILNCMIRTMSTAENLCGIKYKSKKYNIDHNDLSSIKTHEEIKDDFLINIQCLNSMTHLFKKRHNSNFPQVLPPYDKNKLKQDLNYFWKICVSKEPGLDRYFRDFANLIDGKSCQSYTEKEMLSSYKKEEKIDEKKINNIAQNILNQKEKQNRKMKKIYENYNRDGRVDFNCDDDEEMDCHYDEDDN